MTDLSQTIAPKSDQINADDLISGPRTVKITRVSGNEGNAEQPINVFFEGDNGKPFRPCKSMRRVMVQVWGPDGSSYPGRGMTLYRDPEVTFGGMKVGGIRISHMSHIDRDQSVMLTASKAKRKPFQVRVLSGFEEGVDREAVYEEARQAARGGVDDFTKWWNSDRGKENRHIAKDIIEELQAIAKSADQAPAPDDDDPFGLPPADDPTPTQAEKDEAMAAAAAAAASQGEEQ